jgi:hypothetical protein
MHGQDWQQIYFSPSSCSGCSGMGMDVAFIINREAIRFHAAFFIRFALLD